MATYNITVTDPTDIIRLEALIKELESAQISTPKNPASASSKQEIQERINYGLRQIDNGQTLSHEEVVAYMKKLKAGTLKGGNNPNPNPLHIS